MVTLVLLGAITFLATTVQGLTGFAFALIMMPSVTLLLGVRTAAPLVALTALTLYTVNSLRFRASLNLREIWPLGLAACIGVPAGLWLVAAVSDTIVNPLLGAVLISYGVYALTHAEPRQRCSPRWAYLAGFLAGSLGGAYNTPGPPLVVYGTLRQWPKEEYRAGLQALFFVSGAITVLSHALARHLTSQILILYACTPPIFLAGILAGNRLDRYLDKKRFRLLVLGIILLLGLSLVLNLGKR